MKPFVLVMTAALALPLGVAAFAADAPEAPQTPHKHVDKQAATVVKGTIAKIDGQTLTVGDKEVKINDKTKVFQGRKAATADDLKVGEQITARIKDGVAIRIEIRAKAKHTAEDAQAKEKTGGDAK